MFKNAGLNSATITPTVFKNDTTNTAASITAVSHDLVHIDWILGGSFGNCVVRDVILRLRMDLA